MRALASAALALLAAAACVLATAFSGASFTYVARNPQAVSAVTDFLAPSASASVIGKSQGGVAGYLHAGGGYFVYANVGDDGNPASGIASVRANVSSLTSGQTAVTLLTGNYSAGGVAYGYRSAELKAGGGLSAGSKAYSLELVDKAGNARAQSFAATVDNGPLAAASFTTANGTGTAGKADKGDTVSFIFSKPPDPGSILAGWTGTAATTVSVSIGDNSSNDTLTVNGTSAMLGSVSLKGNYTASGRTSTFSGSSMTLSGSALTIVLGSEPNGNATIESTKRAPVWTPSTSVYDVAGNACSATAVTGPSARQF